VDRLKQTLLEALKSAANIRNLKGDEVITLCVVGGAGRSGPVAKHARVEKRETIRKRDPEREDVVVAEPGYSDPQRGSRRTVMTFRVRKSDVDAHAKGKLDLDDFAKKVAITTYAADAGGWSGSGFGGGFGLAR
jgi:hypothetical protein